MSDSDEVPYCIYESEFSLVICGCHDTRWTAYCFVDGKLETRTEIGCTTRGNGDANGNTEPNDDDDDDDDDEHVEEDPVASGTYLAEHPLCDHREYFLWAIEKRMESAVREANGLFKVLDYGFNNHVR
jgi:hypothetical protein